jgi:hypothetical protein
MEEYNPCSQLKMQSNKSIATVSLEEIIYSIIRHNN